jgi:hypothetical protein
MTDERDSRVTGRYRGLGAEEPPLELDRKILSAAREAVAAPHAPLVTPAGRHRWYYGLAAAAVLVLAVAVTVHVEQQQPDEAVPAYSPSLPAAPKEERAAKQAVKPQAKAEASKPAFAPDPKPRAQSPAPQTSASDRALAAAAPAPQEPAAQSGAAASRADAAPKPAARAEAAPEAAMRLQKRAFAEAARDALGISPEQTLQGIADLRRQGRDEEADRALAEFRKRYPDYKIPEAMLERVERRK